ncbi:ABC transporter permease [Streptosporangiaceae bacterium NEAU-GS5]|nr:ABC transporter permease [Streptosporangiaceae bacterium NEAU-GS5]
MHAVRALSWIELKLFLRDPLTVVFALALPPLVLYVLAEVFGNAPDPAVFGGAGPTDYYVPAYIGLVVVSLGIIGLPVHLAAYRERGVLRRFQAVRLPVRALLASQFAVLVAGVAAGSALLMALAKVSYHVSWPYSWPGVGLSAALGVVAFAAIGVLLGAVMPTPRAAQGLGILLWFGMMMLCGAGPPPEVLSTAMNRIGQILPLRHLIVALQDPWLGKGVNWAELAALTSMIVVAGGLAALALRRRR